MTRRAPRLVSTTLAVLAATGCGCAALTVPAARLDPSVAHARVRLAQQQRRSGTVACAAVPSAGTAASQSPAPEEPPPPQQQRQAYGAEQITVLEGLEPVRKRPGMYIGSTGSRGLHHLVFEVVDNSVDEALAGWATEVNVTIHASGAISVSDDGRGIPCELHAKTGKPALETVLTVLHAGGKFGGGGSGYKVSGGLHGVGVSVVNALSERLDAEVRRGGALHRMAFARGAVAEPMQLQPLAASEGRPTGTSITFLPDVSIFKGGLAWEVDVLSRKLDQQAYLNAGLRISLFDERAGPGAAPLTFEHRGGIGEYVDHICEGKVPLFEEGSLVWRAEKGGVQVDLALRWSADQYTDNLLGFANGVLTPQGGTHIDGLKLALTRTVNAVGRESGKLREKAPSLPGDFVREGLCAIVAVRLGEAEFEGQTKQKLGSPEVRAIVSEVAGERLSEFLQRQPKALSAIIDKAQAAQKAADAAKARGLADAASPTPPGCLATPCRIPHPYFHTPRKQTPRFVHMQPAPSPPPPSPPPRPHRKGGSRARPAQVCPRLDAAAGQAGRLRVRRAVPHYPRIRTHTGFGTLEVWY